jgi:hypothetical protein
MNQHWSLRVTLLRGSTHWIPVWTFVIVGDTFAHRTDTFELNVAVATELTSSELVGDQAPIQKGNVYIHGDGSACEEQCQDS